MDCPPISNTHTQASVTDRQRLRVLHVTLNMDIGGTEQVIKQLVLGLDANRFDCAVACVDDHVGVLGKHLEESGILTWSLNRKSGFDTTVVRQLRMLVQSQSIDILHCHQYTPYAYGTLAAMFTDVHIVFTEHGRFFPDSHTFKRRVINQWLRLHTDAITAISNATRSAMAHHEWIPEKSIDVIYNGVKAPDNTSPDASLARSLGLQDHHVVLGTISRLDPIKNHPMMIEAFSIIQARHPEARLLITGDGAERDALEAQVSSLHLTDKVIFAGFQSNPSAYLDLIDIFLLSSHSEGTSMTLIEAMAKGKPCVATAVGGNPEVISHEHDGVLASPDNADEFAAAIDQLIVDQARYERISAAARSTFKKRFELNCMVDAYDRLYVQLCKQSTVPSPAG